MNFDVRFNDGYFHIATYLGMDAPDKGWQIPRNSPTACSYPIDFNVETTA